MSSPKSRLVDLYHEDEPRLQSYLKLMSTNDILSLIQPLNSATNHNSYQNECSYLLKPYHTQKQNNHQPLLL